MAKLSITDLKDLCTKRVLMRVDYNVPLDETGAITDEKRIKATVPSIEHLVKAGAKIVLCYHLGRPKGKRDPKQSLKPCAVALSKILNKPVAFVDDCIGEKVDQAVAALKDGDILLLENLRFYAEEEKNDPAFSAELAKNADVYINDAFGSWQSHASTVDITRYLPSYAGFLLQKEISNLDRVLNPDRPFLAVVAGAKYDTKIGPLNKLYEKVDHLILGGVIYNTYLAAKAGVTISGVSDSDVQAAQSLVAMDAREKKIVELPQVVESQSLEPPFQGQYRTLPISALKPGQRYGYLLDIAPESFEDPRVKEVLLAAKTIFVNAVMGYTPHFTEGSKALDQAIDKNRTAYKMYGGGDTLQEFKDLNPGLYLSVIDNTQYYFFTGGGSVLTAIETGTPYGLKPVQALMENGGKQP